ncbi:putative CmcJ-like methyltransferase [Daldinia loculata]|nr:putative CmcJ-like methyltransferase [Daldinia loculata]
MTVTAIENPDEFKLDVHGFCVVHGSTHLDPDLASVNKKAVQDAYWQEIEAILHKNLPQYSRIEAFDLTVRKRDADFPKILRVYRNKYEQPSAIAHYDWSQQGATTVLEWCFPGNEGFCKYKKFDILNVWRPLREPTNNWPLAFCYYATIDPENDILLNDAIRRDRVEEICVLHSNEAHKWYYLKNQGVDDLFVFRNADSHGEKARGFHAAVNNTMAQGPLRESVEVRLVAIY